MKIVLYTQDEVLLDILSIAIESTLSLKVEPATSDEEAMEVLKSKSDITVLVIDKEDELSPAIAQARKDKIPVIRLASVNGNIRPNNVVGEFVLVKPLVIQNFIELVRIASKDNTPKDDKFCKVRLDTLLLAGNTFSFDVYVRLSESKFVKVIQQGDAFDSGKYAHFAGKGLSSLFVPKESFLEYLRSMAATLSGSMTGDNQSFSLESAVDMSTKVHEAVYNSIQVFGITPEAQQVMKLTIDLAAHSIQKNPRLKELYRVLLNNQENFLAWHSIALCYIAGKISTLMSWDSQNTHYKISLAALMHDMALKKSEWSKANSLADLQKMGLTETEILEYTKHPLMAADLSKQMADYPGDVEFIIAQHHELPDGSGFPHHLNHTKISPLSALFIVAHDLCHKLYELGEVFDMLRFLEEFDQKYPLGYFQKIRQALEESIKNETI